METSRTMRAIVSTRYGTPEVLQLMGVERPVPAENEALVKVHAASLNKADVLTRSGKPFIVRVMAGLLRPKRGLIGADLAGVVEAVGGSVRQFRLGDEVFGHLEVKQMGSFAEYV